ncbi:hypothetical protein ABEB36_008418 [Hypothenemus hampei]|uniref:Uncharacterized protein n=1 Tax=Hypothenemus hampei TaxID=57062 RepID=A0ABD1ELS8_HYPHA
MGIKWTVICLISLAFTKTQAYQSCTDQHLISSDNRVVQTKALSSEDCTHIDFERSEKLHSHLSSWRLAIKIDDNRTYLLNISLLDIAWKKASLRLRRENQPESSSICKSYSIEDVNQLPISQIYDTCLNFPYYNNTVNYELILKAEFNADILYKRMIFTFPTLERSNNAVPLKKRAIFCFLDVSSSSGIFFNIQPLPSFYNVSYYKVEVYKEIEFTDKLLDVRMLNAKDNVEQLSFLYLTYNDEGNYFFKVSAVNEICPEDFCLKTMSPYIFIRRKYPPIVIGIVGASFLIPFILFIFHMWNRKNLLQDVNNGPEDRIFLIHNQTPETHYLIVKALEKVLKTLTTAQIVNKIAEASHIIYICGTHIFELDPNVHKYLVAEANKSLSTIDIAIIRFPYSTKEIPSYLRRSPIFELMEDFIIFIHLFNCEAEYENNTNYLDLHEKIRTAQHYIDPKKIILNVPIIIVTEQSDVENESKEGDVLL